MTTQAHHHNGPKNSKRWLKRQSNWLTWGVVAVVLLLFINVIALRARVASVDAQQAVKTPKSNDAIAVMKFTWQDNVAATPGMFTLAAGDKVVVVATQILNLSDKTIWLAPSIESYIQDATGDRYGMAFATELARPFTAGNYKPQQAGSGELSYAIPTDIKKPEWCYQLAASSGGGVPLCFPLNTYAQTGK